MKSKGKLKSFVKKHRLLSAVIAIVLAAAIAFSYFAISKSNSGGEKYSFIRTTTLTNGTLEDTISTTGTVKSAKTSTVTTSLNYTVKSINVSVGDTVKKGDIICTLDTSELEKQIEKEQSSLEKAKSSAQSSVNSAKTSYNTAKTNYNNYSSTYNSAKSTYESAKKPYDNAVSSLSSAQSAYDKALSAYNSAGAKFVSALSKYNSAVSSYKKGSISKSSLQTAAKNYMKAVQNYYGKCSVGSYNISDSLQTYSNDGIQSDGSSAVSVSKTANDICTEVISTIKTLTGKSLSVPSGSNTLYNLSQKAKALQNAKQICNLSSLESSYNSAKNAYNEAKQTYNQYKEALSQAKEQLEKAQEELENASTSDTLDELKSQLAECSLKAGQDGTVTALNATVGSMCKDAVATIQNLDSLKVLITIEEADINNAQIGQTCRITSDASDETLNGTLTQIDPVSSDSGSFGATVKIDDKTSRLHIGMNASVDIIVNSEDNVYQVPIDAVGTENGEKFVYRKTSGEGTDMQFEKITVTTGESNDYYIEISSDSLNEGDVIRSSSNLKEGIETVSSSDSEKSSGGLFSSLFGGGRGNDDHGPDSNMGGKNMPDRNSNSNSGDGMGAPPSGNMPGENNGSN